MKSFKKKSKNPLDTAPVGYIRDTVMGRLNMLWGNKTCSQCGTIAWDISDGYVKLPLYTPGGTAKNLFLAVTTCRACGHTVFVNMKAAQILTEKAATVEAAPEPKGKEDAE